MEHHTDLRPGQTTTIHDARETAERREEAERAQRETALVARRSAGPASEIAGYIQAVKP